MKLIACLVLYCLFGVAVYFAFNFPKSTLVHIEGQLIKLDLKKGKENIIPTAVIKKNNEIITTEITPDQYSFFKVGENVEINRYESNGKQVGASILIFCACIFLIVELVIGITSFNDSVLGNIGEEFSELLEKFNQ